MKLLFYLKHMMYNKLIIAICSLLLVCCSTEVAPVKNADSTDTLEKNYQVHYEWEDDFEEQDKIKLQTWIEEISEVTQSTIGTYQFDVYYHFHQSKGNEPVPYAHTSRQTNHQAVHFYVNPKFSLPEFMADWTAQHEISHLSLPFVGKKNMWFSEGYATYMSRQIMINQGIYTALEFDSIYYHRIKGDKYISALDSFTIPKVCQKLKSNHNYPSIYYAGSSYFYIANQQLKKNHQTSLMDVIKKYQVTKRLKDKGLKDVLKSLDDVIGDRTFTDLYSDFENNSTYEVLNMMQL
ncbi:MAG: hypothetical protein AB8B72_11435 [Crocinitomicaceae bacterium]